MIRTRSEKLLPIETALDKKNLWDRLSERIPLDAVASNDTRTLSVKQRRPTKDKRLIISAVIIKHKLCLSDENTVELT